MNDIENPTDDGRDRATGRFLVGNRGGPGNPQSAHVMRFRRELFEAVEPGEIRLAARRLIDAAKGGDLDSIKELFDRVIGKPIGVDVAIDIAELSARVELIARGTGGASS